MLSNPSQAAILVTLPIAAWLGLLSMVQVYAAAALVGAASVLFDIADHAYLPGLVGKALIVDANARISATESVAEMAGPALAGLLFQWLTAPISEHRRRRAARGPADAAGPTAWSPAQGPPGASRVCGSC
jgi:multisubunit Na+/H+ antiporter MnhG subunit